MEALSLKEALHNTIHRHSRLSVAAIAEEVDMTEGYLYKAALPDQDMDSATATGVRFPLKKLIPLIRATQDFQVLDFIEAALGRVAVPLPDDGVSAEEVQTALCSTIKEFGDVVQITGRALADNRITIAEAGRIKEETWELIRQATLFLHVVEASQVD